MTWKLDCGAYTLFIIEDGFYWRDPDGYHDEAAERDWRFHRRNDEGKVRMNFGCYLITDGDRTIMIDAGIGDTRLLGYCPRVGRDRSLLAHALRPHWWQST